jgi:uncharacterized membrane protein YgcG
MKHSLLIAVLSIGLLTGCSTASNISTQTPDDVYYSPAQGTPGSPVAQRQQDRYEQYMSSNDDRYLAMKVQDPTLWSSLDDYSYWYDSRYSYYNYGYANNWYMNPYSYDAFSPFYINFFYGGYYGWSIWDNPVYVVACYKNTKVSTYTSGSNITAYQNRNYNNTNSVYLPHKSYSYTIPGNNNNTNNNTNSFGNIIRRTFSPSSSLSNSSPNNTTYSNPVRTYAPTSTGTPATSSSAGGSSGGYNSTGSSSSGGRGSRSH